jgi:hypothetical protein
VSEPKGRGRIPGQKSKTPGRSRSYGDLRIVAPPGGTVTNSLVSKELIFTISIFTIFTLGRKPFS